MKMRRQLYRYLWIALAAGAVLLPAQAARGYVEAAYTLGQVIEESTNVVVVRVEKVDRQKNLIVYKKVRDIKGTHPTDTIKHDIGQRGFHPREWQGIMAWAEEGKTAIFFHNGGAGEVCIDNYWYQVYAGDWWALSHAEPYLLRTYAGKPERLEGFVQQILAGQEVVVPCMVDGDKNALQLRAARLQRMRASRKIKDYNPKRDFAGWGVEEFRLILDMPGFTHYSALNRTDPGAAGIAVTDLDGDGKPDFLLFGEDRMVMLQNAGGSFNEVSLPAAGGARAAAWADCNGDGKPDLLLATPSGPRLLLFDGTAFKDATSLLPRMDYYNATAAAWIDYDGDGRPDILVSDGFRGLRLYRNMLAPAPPPAAAPAAKPAAAPAAAPAAKPAAPAAGAPPAAAAKAPALPPMPPFVDVSAKVGLGVNGVGGLMKGDHVAVADVNGDGRPDILYSAGTGLLILNTPQEFVEAENSGIAYQTGGAAPVFGDSNGDGLPDLFVPQRGVCKLFRNDGKGHFTDVTAKSGALAMPVGYATCAVWSDFNRRGRLDLLVGCFRGPNRYFRNQGNGTFVDAGEELGFYQRIFNSRALAVMDVNKDGVPDLVLNNEGQESAVILGNPARIAPAPPAAPAVATGAK